jgi:hypothetical protein
MLPPLYSFIDKEAQQVMNSFKCSGRLRTGHSLVYDKMIKESHIIALKTALITHTNVHSKVPYQGVMNETAENFMMSDGITCYTDSSYCDNRSGAGVFSDTLNLKESYSLGKYTTVFRAEVYAILACSVIFQKVALQNETIHIFSDSKVMQCWISILNRVCL